MVEGSGAEIKVQSGSLIINWLVTPARKIIEVGKGLFVYLLGL